MFNIISDGTKKIYFHQCPKCSSEFEYGYDNVLSDRLADSLYRHRVVCPVCHECILVNLDTKEEFFEHAKNNWFDNSKAAILASMMNQCAVKKEEQNGDKITGK